MKPAVLRKAIPRAMLDLCPEPAFPPSDMPRWWGERLWSGTRTEREEPITEYLLHDRKYNRRPILRIRAAEKKDDGTGDGLLGIYGPNLSKSGAAMPVPTEHQALAARLEETLETGFEWAPGVKLTGVLQALDALVTNVDRFTYTALGRRRVRVRTTPALYRVAWAGFLYTSTLVWDFDHDAPAAYLFERVGRETQRLSLGRELAHLGAKTANKRCPWWDTQTDEDARALALDLLHWARRVVEHPPPWPWWAGTAARCTGFVERSWTGARAAVQVRSGDPTKRTATRVVVRRFVRPPDPSEPPEPRGQLAMSL